MIHEVMVVSQGGLCFYYYEFTKMKIDPQLVAGFTNAIDSFSESLIKEEQNIETLQMSALNLRISPFLNKSLTIIIFYNKYDRLDIIDSIIIDLQTQFIERFGHHDMMDFVDMTILKPFDEDVISLCKTHLDIGLISSQSPYKTKLWKIIEEINTDQKNIEPSPSTRLENPMKLNTIEYQDPDLPNCDISLWNLDLETIESTHHIFLNKQIFIFIVEPDFKFIQQNLSHLELLKKTFTDSNMHPHIIGILLTDYGTITKKNCEMLLQIPLNDFYLDDPNQKNKMKSILHEAIIGVSKNE